MSNHLSPHDRFFRKLMAKPKVIREFVDNYLPAHIRKIIKPETIRLQKESFINDKLRMRVSDILYTAQFGDKEGYLYLLIEHQSTVDELMPFRNLKYKVDIMDFHITKTNSTVLPVVYSVVLYNGARDYNKSTNLFDLFGDQKALAEETFYEPFHLVDLRTIPTETLNKLLWFGTFARIMRDIHQPDVLPSVKSIIFPLKEIEKCGDNDYIYTFLSYVIEAGEISDQEEFIETIKNGLEIKEEKFMTLAETWLRKGEQKGRQEGEAIGEARGEAKGREETLYEMIMKLSDRGLSVEDISQITNLPADEIVKIIADSKRDRH